MNKKYSIFISSTYKDLKEYRKNIHDSIIRSGHFPIAMENFTASDKTQWEIIKPLIDSCDYYVLLVGFSYGTIDKSENISYTEKEYNYALSINKPILSFILDDSFKGNTTCEHENRLNLFKNKILQNNKLAQYCKKKSEISTDIITALNKEYKRNPQNGWIRNRDYQILKQKYEDLSLDYDCIINPTDFSDLIDLDNKVTLTGHYSNYNNWYITTTFKKVFIVISQLINKFPMEELLFEMLAQKLEYIGEIPEYKIHIDTDSKMKIRNRLKKSNLITLSSYMTEKGKTKYWKLTKKGEEYFLSIG